MASSRYLGRQDRLTAAVKIQIHAPLRECTMNHTCTWLLCSRCAAYGFTSMSRIRSGPCSKKEGAQQRLCCDLGNPAIHLDVTFTCYTNVSIVADHIHPLICPASKQWFWNGLRSTSEKGFEGCLSLQIPQVTKKKKKKGLKLTVDYDCWTSTKTVEHLSWCCPGSGASPPLSSL